MIIKTIDKNFYILKVFNKYLDFDIYNHDEVKDFIYKLYDKILCKYNLKGFIIFDIYIDNNYGMIIEIKKEDNIFLDKLTDIKIKFNINISFLYEIDYFYLLEEEIKNQVVYYYRGKFYLEIVNDIESNKFIKILENSKIVYNQDINNIINNGIKLANIYFLWYNIIT